MKRFQRNYGRTIKRDELDQQTADPSKEETEEVPLKKKKLMTNRCCSVSPVRRDKSQVTVPNGSQEYESLILEHYDIDPTVTDAIKQLKELRHVLHEVEKSDKCCQYTEPKEYVSNLQTTGAHWQNVNSTDDVDVIMKRDTLKRKINANESFTNNIHITKTPRVKVIAEKFLKLRKDNVELRKLDEKIVCMEYDVFQDERPDEPVQKMRAYFSVKPTEDVTDDDSTAALPLLIHNHFRKTSDDFGEFNDKEIEIIDSKTIGNKTYLDDLNKVLKRKRIINDKKRKNSLDLKSLYKMAMKETRVLEESFSNINNLLSKTALKEIKNQILNKLPSSSHTIRRRIFKGGTDLIEAEKHRNITDSLFAELTKKE